MTPEARKARMIAVYADILAEARPSYNSVSQYSTLVLHSTSASDSLNQLEAVADLVQYGLVKRQLYADPEVYPPEQEVRLVINPTHQTRLQAQGEAAEVRIRYELEASDPSTWSSTDWDAYYQETPND